MVKVTVKWNKETYDVDVDPTQPVSLFKTQLQSLTNIPPERQKLMGLKGGMPKDDALLGDLGVKEGMKIMLLGTAELAAAPDPEEIKKAMPSTTTIIEMPPGLVNFANNCWLNSVTQLLRIVPEMRPILAQGTTAVERALNAVFGQTQSPQRPLALYTSFIHQFPEFAQLSSGPRPGPMQHDTQEALSALLQLIKNTVDQKNMDKYKHLFRGTLEERRTAVDVPELPVAVRPTNFEVLQCSLAGDAKNLEYALELSLNTTVEAQCDQLGRNVTYKSVSRFTQLPEYFCVQLLRFGWRKDANSKTKNIKPISFPKMLDIQRLCSDELKEKMAPERAQLKERRDKAAAHKKRMRAKTKHDDEEQVAEPVFDDHPPEVVGNTSGYYDLAAVISHKGLSAESGHYCAWVKSKGNWMVCDDENVAVVGENHVLNVLKGVGEAPIAYVLLYRSRDPDTNVPAMEE